MSFNCEFCKKVFKSKSNLTRHKRTTKSCIVIQKSLSKNDNIVEITYDCSICFKKFTSKQILLLHIQTCPGLLIKENYENKINKLILEYENKIKEIIDKTNLDSININDLEKNIIRLESELKVYKEHGNKSYSTIEEMAKQPKQVTNNQNKIIITSPLNLSRDSITEALENFSDNHLVQGQRGVAKFAYDNMLKDKDGKLIYICTDPSRQIFQFKNDEGKIEKDVRATRLTKALIEADIKQTSHKIAWDNMKDGDNEIFMTYTNHYQEIQEMEQDNSQFSKELCCLTSK
tara:strand:+ start:132 stop:998 length:867 start_codon:yes stop_codon:yes gene_type:complete